MSWAEEQWWFGLEDLALEAEERRMNAQELVQQNIWVQANGEKISLLCMADSHLYNCIRMIKSGRLNRPWALPYLEAEIKRRTKFFLPKED